MDPRFVFKNKTVQPATAKVVLNVVRKTQPNDNTTKKTTTTTIINKRNRDEKEDSTTATQVVNKKWPPEHILELILAYKGQPCLWDLKHPHYRNKGKRMLALAGIRQLMDIFRPGVTEDDILRQWNSVRTQFTTEFNKMNERLPSGSPAPETPSEPYISSMTHFDELMFLSEQVGGRKSTCSLELTQESEGGGGIDDAILQDENEDNFFNSDKGSTNRTKKKKKEEKLDINSFISASTLAMRALSNPNSQSPTPPPPPPPPAAPTAPIAQNGGGRFAAFGQYIVSQLSNLPADRAIELEGKILDAIRSTMY